MRKTRAARALSIMPLLGRFLPVALLLLAWGPAAARADFLILKNGKSFQGTTAVLDSGDWTCSSSEFRWAPNLVARISKAATVEAAISDWAAELGKSEDQDSFLHLARFCLGRRKQSDALRHFSRWAELCGWKVAVSKYYFVLSDAPPRRVDEIKGRLDAIMDLYQAILKSERKPGREFVVRFFATEGGFDAFAAMHGVTRSGAYFSSWDRELVLWDMSGIGKKYTFESVFHETNHQYLETYYLDCDVEYYWLSEGLATYFETANYQGGTIADVGKTQKESLKEIQAAIRDKQNWSLPEFLALKRDRFYDGQWKSLNYAQAWSVVHFCLHGPEPKARAFFNKYVLTLRETKSDGTALREASKGVDMGAFEKAWLDYTKALRLSSAD